MRQINAQLRRVSKRLILSYVADWIIMVAILGIAGGFSYIDSKSTRHAFYLQDPSISYPHTDDLISNVMLYVASGILPAIIIALICLVAVPRPNAVRGSPSSGSLWRRKLWELNVGWLGLALSLFGAIAITNGLKPLAGKPRPHLLSVCDPDLSSEAISRWRVGGLGGVDFGVATAPILVTWEICRNTDKDVMKNAFASWPSGHASTSWSGLLYLTFFFCAKLGVKIPSLWSSFLSRQTTTRSTLNEDSDLATNAARREPDYQTRDEAAAPPAYLLLLAVVPVCVAFFISISRWFDYRHHGFDIISGAVIGIFFAWLSFHIYQVPIGLGDGWAWAPRARGQAFGLLVGGRSYGRSAELGDDRVGDGRNGESVRMGKVKAKSDLENQAHTNGQGQGSAWRSEGAGIE